MKYLFYPFRFKGLLMALLVLFLSLATTAAYCQKKPVKYEAKALATYSIDEDGNPGGQTLTNGYWLIVWDTDKKKLMVFSDGSTQGDFDIISDLYYGGGEDTGYSVYFSCVDEDYRKNMVTVHYVKGKANLVSVKYKNKNSTYVISGVK